MGKVFRSRREVGLCELWMIRVSTSYFQYRVSWCQDVHRPINHSKLQISCVFNYHSRKYSLHLHAPELISMLNLYGRIKSALEGIL